MRSSDDRSGRGHAQARAPRQSNRRARAGPGRVDDHDQPARLRRAGGLAADARTGRRVGIEGAGSYGAGLCEYLLAEGFDVVEVERPRREDRRRGKSDEIDALLAAKKVLVADGLSTPRAGGTRQALAALLIAQRSCISERTRLVNQLQSLHTTAPVALRERIGPGNGRKLAARLVKMRARTDAPQSERLIFTV